MQHRSRSPRDYWGLDRWPFSSVPDAGQFYPSSGHNEALARIEYLVDARRRLGVLLGEPGVGKTLIAEVAARRLARAGKAVIHADSLGLSPRELLWHLAIGLRTAPREDADQPRLWRQIADRVAENRLQQVDTVLIVDDAGQAGPDVLLQFTRLARLDCSPHARWTIVLISEPDQAARWASSLRELIDLRIDVEPWDEAETIGYVQTALVEAGSTRPLFDGQSLSTLYSLSNGNPRKVARLADFALVAGAAAGAQRVDASLVQTAADEMAWPEAMASAY